MRTYVFVINMFYPTWSVLTEDRTFGDEDADYKKTRITRRKSRPEKRKPAKSTAKTSKHLSDRKIRRKKKTRKQETSKRTCEETTCSIRNHTRYARPRRSPRTRAESDRNKSVQHREITKDRAI